MSRTCIECGKQSKGPTTNDIAGNWRLFCEYVNADGAMSHTEWESLTREEIVDGINRLWPECDDRCECES